MKNHTFFLSIVTASAIGWCVALPIAATLTACKSPSTQRASVNTLFTVGKTVDVAYRSYLDLIVAGDVATNAVPQIAGKYNQFQTAFALAVALVASNTNAPAPPSLIAEAAILTGQIENAKKGINP